MAKWYLLIITHICLTGLLRAAAQSDTISFSQAREIILKQNAGLKSSQTETTAAQEGVSQAGVLPNPDVGVALDKFGTNEIEVSVGQTIELGGKRMLRTEIARKELEAAENNTKIIQTELEAEIIRRFIPIVISERKLIVLDSLIAIATSGKEQIESRVNAGAIKKTDLIQSEIELEQYTLDRSEFLQQSKQARKKFAALAGIKSEQIINVVGILDAHATIPSVELLKQAIMSSPQIISFDINKNRLATEQKLLRAQAKPDLNLSAGVLGSNLEDRISPLVGLSMDIPLFNRNSAAQKQSELLQQSVEQQKENLLTLIEAEIENFHSRLIQIDKQINSLLNSTIPKSEEAYSMLQDYYNAGKTGYLDLTSARAKMLDLQLNLLDLETEKCLAIADLIQTTTLQIPIAK
jgi:cobalt-zinc-cadmium efflux system outer membrane protein